MCLGLDSARTLYFSISCRPNQRTNTPPPTRLSLHSTTLWVRRNARVVLPSLQGNIPPQPTLHSHHRHHVVRSAFEKLQPQQLPQSRDRVVQNALGSPPRFLVLLTWFTTARCLFCHHKLRNCGELLCQLWNFCYLRNETLQPHFDSLHLVVCLELARVKRSEIGSSMTWLLQQTYS